jgi:hypothetical protein
MTASLPAATVKDVFDINDNGRLGLPDLLASLFFGTVGVLGVMVLAGMALGALVMLVRAVVAAARGVAGVVRSST